LFLATCVKISALSIYRYLSIYLSI